MRRWFGSTLRRLGFASIIAAGLWASATPAAAQQRDTAAARRAAEARLGRDVSQEEILGRLRESGMTRSQVRARLQALGYDPGLADAYFDALEARDGEAPEGRPSRAIVDAMVQRGLKPAWISKTWEPALSDTGITRDGAGFQIFAKMRAARR